MCLQRQVSLSRLFWENRYQLQFRVGLTGTLGMRVEARSNRRLDVVYSSSSNLLVATDFQ